MQWPETERYVSSFFSVNKFILLAVWHGGPSCWKIKSSLHKFLTSCIMLWHISLMYPGTTFLSPPTVLAICISRLVWKHHLYRKCFTVAVSLTIFQNFLSSTGLSCTSCNSTLGGTLWLQTKNYGCILPLSCFISDIFPWDHFRVSLTEYLYFVL